MSRAQTADKIVNAALKNAITSVPPGPWAVAVSGGADSVALLTLLHARADLSLHVVHLNHQTRGSESDGDAEFVAELANKLNLPCTIELRSRMETELTELPNNPSARYRRMRLSLFRTVVEREQLNGVLLAHHADDQAETIMLRLLRGSSFTGLAGMAVSSSITSLRCFRPLLAIRRDELRQWLKHIEQPWREDSSNQSPRYSRNRVRLMLRDEPNLTEALQALGASCGALKAWIDSHTPAVDRALPIQTIANLPQIVARANVRKWLLASGVSPEEIDPATIARVLALCLDASTPARVQLPGGVIAGRRRGIIEKVSPVEP